MSQRKSPPPIPIRPPTPISQEEISLILGFETLILQRQEFFQRLYLSALDRLRAAALVEEGEHTLALAPGGRYLVIDGKPHVEFLPQ